MTDSFLRRPLLCDATLRSPLKGNGEPHPRAATEDSKVFERAAKDKEDKYLDVHASSLAELVVLACEVGGRFSEQATDWVRYLAKEKARKQHPLLKRSVELAWSDRWWALLGVTTQDALAASLLAPTGRQLVLDDNSPPEPALADLLDGQRWAVADWRGEEDTGEGGP